LKFLKRKERLKLKYLLSKNYRYETKNLDAVLKIFLSFVKAKKRERKEYPVFLLHLLVISLGLLVIIIYLLNPRFDILKTGGGVIIFFLFVYLFMFIEYGNIFFYKYIFPKNFQVESEIGILSGIFLSILLFIRNLIYYAPTIKLSEEAFLIFAISRIFVAPLLEEILFRFLLTEALEKLFKEEKNLLYIASSFIFSISHLPSGIIEFFLYMIAGWVLLYLYKKYKTLYPGIIAHSIANLSIVIL
jgi:membrane protease YdiL (CAAX protease family)